MDGIRTEGEFWRRCLTYLSDLIAQWSGGVTITNTITEPIPVQQADLNADVDEVTAFGGALTTYIDAASATVTYIGEAAIGSSVASAAWRVQKIDTTLNPNTIKWAGTGVFDQVWNNRAGLTYS